MAVNNLNVNANRNDNYLGFNMDALPEDCIATALSLTSPRDACRLALVASIFRSAAQSNAVWERFLPPDYQQIVSASVQGSESLLSLESKKELYFYLCDHHILVDGGSKSFSLEKISGKKCFMLAARDLMIVWGDTPQYWNWISLPESRFNEVAELLSVCWFDVCGKIKTSMLSPNTTYSASLVFTMNSGIHGFAHQAAEGSFGISGQESETRRVWLDLDGAERHRYQSVPRRRGRSGNIRRGEQPSSPFVEKVEFPKKRYDMWSEVLLGEFHINQGQDCELEIRVMEIKAGNWKGGLIIEGIEIRPK